MRPGCLFGAPAADPDLANKSCYEADPAFTEREHLPRVAGPMIQLEMSAFDALKGRRRSQFGAVRRM